jgi:hypothetical protein
LIWNKHRCDSAAMVASVFRANWRRTMTISEAAHIYGLDPDLLVLELESAVERLES